MVDTAVAFMADSGAVFTAGSVISIRLLPILLLPIPILLLPLLIAYSLLPEVARLIWLDI